MTATTVNPHSITEAGAHRESTAGGVAILAYAAAVYALFVGTLVYAVLFVGNWFVPKTIDSGAAGPLVPSLLINAALLSVFVVQHTIMARPWFKRWITQYIPAAAERSTFVLAASLSLVLLVWQWRPAPAIVWHVETPALRVGLIALSLAGYTFMLASSFIINHFDLFGLRQALLRLRGKREEPVEFQVRSFYSIVRHPLMLGFLVAFWATPTMTVGHLFFAIMVTAYIYIGVQFEERDLIAVFGERYRQYKRSVPGILPFPRSRG